MKITELEIDNIANCKKALLQFPPTEDLGAVYLSLSNNKCEVIAFALQLICSTKYITDEALHEIKDKIVNGKVKITFTLIEPSRQQQRDENNDTNTSTGVADHSSDSDVPCTSFQAQERRRKRSQKSSLKGQQARGILVIKACRDFRKGLDVIEYSVNNGRLVKCSVTLFQVRFFTCTDIIFPRLSGLQCNEYCNGRWLDLMSTEFTDRDIYETNLIIKFCNLFANHKVDKDHILSQLTTTVLKARNALDHARLTQLILVFTEIRFLFEYITCFEYTVWFYLPTWFGHHIDISQITTENVNFDLMKTFVQVKSDTNGSEKILWNRAAGHIQELLLVAIQIAFGYHCQQNIVYLLSLEELRNFQNLEFLKYTTSPYETFKEYYFTKNYFQRILNVCARLSICCVVEYRGGLPFYPRHAHPIKCIWINNSEEWQICLKDASTMRDVSSDEIYTCLEDAERIKLSLRRVLFDYQIFERNF